MKGVIGSEEGMVDREGEEREGRERRIKKGWWMEVRMLREGKRKEGVERCLVMVKIS